VEELRALVGQLRTNLEARGRSGLVGVVVTKTAPGVAAAAQPVASGVRSAPEPRAHVEAHQQSGEAPAEKPRTGTTGLKVLRDEIGDCQRCKPSPSRTNVVYGVGNPDADLVVVGEAPGADEDAQRAPSVGQAA